MRSKYTTHVRAPALDYHLYHSLIYPQNEQTETITELWCVCGFLHSFECIGSELTPRVTPCSTCRKFSYVNHNIHNVNASNPSNFKPVSHDVSTKYTEHSPDVDFESVKTAAKSASWNEPSLHSVRLPKLLSQAPVHFVPTPPLHVCIRFKLVFFHMHPLYVEELYPTPHIHEQMTAYIMATTTSTLSQTR